MPNASLTHRRHARHFLLALALAGCLLAVPAAAVPTASATPMNVMVPAYFDPPSTYWNRLVTQSAVIPGRLVAIANKNEGPGPTYDPAYDAAIDAMHANSGRVIGYVDTAYADIPLADAKSVIDDWFAFYEMDGVFFDQVPNTDGEQAYYEELYDYVKAQDPAALVVHNPGINTLESWLFHGGERIADITDIFETNSGQTTWSASSWVFGYDRGNFEALPYGVPTSKYRAAIARAWSQNVGWIYVTSDGGANPWDTLPSYFESEVAYVKANYG